MHTAFSRFAMKRSAFRLAGLAFFAVAGLLFTAGEARAAQAPMTVDRDLVIPLADMSSTAIFYPVQIKGNIAEFFAVRASDNTVRVVVNACQSCGPAGYSQDGDEFVCSACGQKFHVDDLEKKKGGCNPIPVGDNNKRVEADRIVFSKNFLEKVTTSRFAKSRKK